MNDDFVKSKIKDVKLRERMDGPWFGSSVSPPQMELTKCKRGNLINIWCQGLIIRAKIPISWVKCLHLSPCFVGGLDD